MSGPKTWADTRGAVLYRDDYICQICGDCEATDVDHIWPKSAGGSDDLDNLQAACGRCNKVKSKGYNLLDATIVQLMWLQNSRNERLEAAEDAADETRSWVRFYGPALTQPGSRIAECGGEGTKTGTMLAETFDMISRQQWSSGSWAGLTRSTILQAAEEQRRRAVDRYSLLMAECEAAEQLVEIMQDVNVANLRDYVRFERGLRGAWALMASAFTS